MIERALLIAAALAAVSLAWLWWSRRDGKVERMNNASRVPASTLGTAYGAHATVVQFSTPMCAKCPPTARMLTRLAAERDHVVHVEIDVADRLDIAREYNVMRTPTVLVLDSDGVIVARMSGAPSPEQAREALDAVPPPTDYDI